MKPDEFEAWSSWMLLKNYDHRDPYKTYAHHIRTSYNILENLRL